MTSVATTATNDLAFSHFGFFVEDLARQAGFYEQVLGFTRTDEGRLGSTDIVFLSRDPDEHHQIVLMSGRPAELAFNVINQISLKVPTLAALKKYHARLVASPATQIETVTHGNAISIYCRDPEGNRLELYVNTTWYCEQPLKVAIDLSQTDQAIVAAAEDIARRSPRFQARADWRAALARRMADDQAR